MAGSAIAVMSHKNAVRFQMGAMVFSPCSGAVPDYTLRKIEAGQKNGGGLAAPGERFD
jgi:hypothetical protein